MPSTALAVHLNRLQLLADEYRLVHAQTPREIKLAEEIRREIEEALAALTELARRHSGRSIDVASILS